MPWGTPVSALSTGSRGLESPYGGLGVVWDVDMEAANSQDGAAL